MRQVIETGFLYTIYKLRGVFYVDLYKTAAPCAGYSTLAAAREAVYYAGLRNRKEV